MRAGLAGSSGFVGSAVGRHLAAAGYEVIPVPTPRLTAQSVSAGELIETAERYLHTDPSIEELLRDCQVLVNAAGNPDASSRDRAMLLGANALTTAILAAAAQRAHTARVVQVSSAVVQNDRPTLDDAPAGPAFSAYSESKVAAERVIEELAKRSPATTFVIYRPPSVHSPDRRVSRMLTKIARSPFSAVAGAGTSSSPQALIDNVASAVVFLATCPQRPPLRVHHPSEALSTAELMRILGDREPIHLPVILTKGFVDTLKLAGTWIPGLSANARRVEILWLGQNQATSWLTRVSWKPPVGREGWVALGRMLSSGTARPGSHRLHVVRMLPFAQGRSRQAAAMQDSQQAEPPMR
jgi:nucleoside-diphosphate-sugar epimerase